MSTPVIQRGVGARAWRHLGVRVGAVMVGAISLLALVGPWLAPFDPTYQDITGGLGPLGEPLGPSAAHWLGTDNLGRDLLSRLLVGAQVSMLVGVAGTGIALGLGLAAGMIAGYFRGWIDTLLMRITDVVLSFPFLLLCIALVGVRDKRETLNVLVVLGLVGWTTMARVVRGKVLAVRELEYIEAARALGVSHLRILTRHVLPNVLGPVVVLATLGVAGTILSESVLSYLGMGVPPPQPSWGSMIAEGQAWYRLGPHLIVWPGAMILLTVLGFNLLGEGLRDVLDPRE